MLGYLSADIICSEKRTVFREFSIFVEHGIMAHIPRWLSQWKLFNCIIQWSRFNSSFSWGIFGHVTRLDQSRASEKIWWIIIVNIPEMVLVSGNIISDISDHFLHFCILTSIVNQTKGDSRKVREFFKIPLRPFHSWNPKSIGMKFLERDNVDVDRTFSLDWFHKPRFLYAN